MPLIEVATNVTAGHALTAATQNVVFPWFELHSGVGKNLAIGVIFVGISLLRGYPLRRLSER